MTHMLVSGIVPIHNEARVLQKVLWSIRHQTLPLDELILVFDRCTDESELVADGPEFKKMRIDAGSMSRAVRAGIGAARNDCFVVFDANTLVPSNYVSGLVTTLQTRSADVVEWHGGMLALTRSTLERFGPFSDLHLWTLEYFVRVKRLGGLHVNLRGPYVRLKRSPLRRNVWYGLDYASLSERYGLHPLFRIGTKSGLVPDSIALICACVGHAKKGHLMEALGAARRSFSRPESFSEG